MMDAGPVPQRGPGPAYFLRRGIVVVLGMIVVFSLLGIGLVRSYQSRMIFPHPSSQLQRPQALIAAGGEVRWLDVDGDRVEAWFLPSHSALSAPLLIHAHGNGELIDLWPEEVAPLRAAGIAVLLVEYPGYGRSEGSPSEESVTAAMLAAYDVAVRDPRVDATRIIGYGRSLGGGAIAQLAARRPLAALLLQSSFTSVADMAHGRGIPDWLVLYRFDTRAVLAKYPRPILLIHGTGDRLIPVAHARANLAAAQHATLHLLDCGHNDCPPQWELVLSFLAQNGVCRKPDQEDSHEHVC